MPTPQAASRPNVAIPISSLLSDTGANYGPDDGQVTFGSAVKQEEDTKQDSDQIPSRLDKADDNYDDEEEAKPDASMQSESPAQGNGLPTSATSQLSATTYKREEDEDYDEE